MCLYRKTRVGKSTNTKRTKVDSDRSRHSHKPVGIQLNQKVYSVTQIKKYSLRLTKDSIGLQQDKSYQKVEYQNLPTQSYHRPIDINFGYWQK